MDIRLLAVDTCRERSGDYVGAEGKRSWSLRYMRSQNSQLHRHRKHNSGHQGLQGGVVGSSWLMATEFLSGKMKKFLRWKVVTVAEQ